MAQTLGTKEGSRSGVGIPIVVALVISVLALGLAGFSIAQNASSQDSSRYNPAPVTKEFVVFSNVAEFNDTEVGIPHDQFTPSTLVVNQGDTVLIHFYNTEDEPENHNFILAAYSINVDLAQNRHQDITFTASQAGVFRFYCSYHQPTMNGQLIVLPTNS